MIKALYNVTNSIIEKPHQLAQNLANSKINQSIIFAKFMLPRTYIVKNNQQLLKTLTNFDMYEYVISKNDKGSRGFGVKLWNNKEHLYCANESLQYPFVIQEYLFNPIDVRVILCGNYVESYRRYNKNNFRNNIANGGESSPYELSESQLQFCREIMFDGRFPYAHIDLLIDKCVENQEKTYFSEIHLNGGIIGAKITDKALKEMKREMLERL